MKWTGAICLEIELMLVEVHTEITDIGKKGDEFHKETENK
jgi:hypothetical protein